MIIVFIPFLIWVLLPPENQIHDSPNCLNASIGNKKETIIKKGANHPQKKILLVTER